MVFAPSRRYMQFMPTYAMIIEKFEILCRCMTIKFILTFALTRKHLVVLYCLGIVLSLGSYLQEC